MQTYTFHVSGMHCGACALSVEQELRAQPGVSTATVQLKHHTVSVSGNFGDVTPQQVAERLAQPLHKLNYTLALERKPHTPYWRDFAIALPLAAAFLLLFIVLQKMGIVNLLTVNQISYPAAFAIGLIASVSSCMAVVGGLTLSISASYAKEGSGFIPQLLFHMGRLAAFFVLGGLMGLLGSQLVITPNAGMWLSMLAGIVMLLLGLNLLNILPSHRMPRTALPRAMAHHMLRLKHIRHTLMPLVLGGATFFLPCGFTQSMQIYALSTGSFMQSGLSLLAFALGTFPMLAVLSFTPLAAQTAKNSGVIFKTAGLIVIAFAFFNLMNALVVAGVIQPVIRL